MSDTHTMTTWQREDGEAICGEYSHVTHTDWFDDNDDPERLIRRRWVLVDEEVGSYWPGSVQLCDDCEGEGGNCPTCDGTGEHPLRGAGWVPDV